MNDEQQEQEPGDPAQIARRARMRDVEALPVTHLERAWFSVGLALLGRGNRPDRELAAAVQSVLKAIELGVPVDELDLLGARPSTRGLPEEADLRRVWLAVASTVEGLALERHREATDALSAMAAESDAALADLT